ncbi:hypothetical protein MKJ04_02800 [Pontibacter sp. E15-1]|uniref:hypothetical protein n=1 Tax=Pontibacter sp. E15-1 TaxID=2919918 RepID=UPI001F4F84E9|nr:hypothetical protein [Pontibacter sp. E15-1]MCJ8163753.1 hypothetical protein [Pontibacter sp. E15-1]
MKFSRSLLLLASFFIVLTSCHKDDYFTPEPPGVDIDPDDFVMHISNPYFPLVPGTTYYYVNTSEEDGETSTEDLKVEVTHDTKVIMGVTCRVVHDVATDEDGNVIEDTFDWYAQDKRGNVWYFGEDTKAYEDGEVSTAGSWEAGVDGAEPGILMYAKPLAHRGEPYYQEFYPGVAVDQAIVLDANNTVEVPYGTFTNCLRTKEFTALEPGVAENKYYAKGVGFVLAVKVEGGNDREELVRITH